MTGLVVFLVGVVLPVIVRLVASANAAVYAIPFAAILVLVGGFLYIRR
jgi:hypothetical protein